MAQYTRSLIVPIDGIGTVLVFDVNPNEITISKANRWAEIPVAGRLQPYLHFGCGEARRVQFSAQLTRENRNAAYIKRWCDNLMLFMAPTVRGAGLWRPPRVQLIIGSHLSMTGIVVDVRTNFGGKGNSGPTYLAEPRTLLPKFGHVDVRIEEFL